MSYAKGRRLEYRTIRYLEARGYRCIRSAGSHGPVDVVAVNGTGGLFVQVKANRLPSPQEREHFAAFPCPPGFKRILHRWRDYGKEPEVNEIRIRAIRKLGEMLKPKAAKATGGDAQRTRYHKVTESPPTLRDLGLTKRESGGKEPETAKGET